MLDSGGGAHVDIPCWVIPASALLGPEDAKKPTGNQIKKLNQRNGGKAMDVWKTLQSDESIKELEQQFMDLDSMFKFKCRQCGKCCKNQNTILFSPWDVFKIAKRSGSHCPRS